MPRRLPRQTTGRDKSRADSQAQAESRMKTTEPIQNSVSLHQDLEAGNDVSSYVTGTNAMFESFPKVGQSLLRQKRREGSKESLKAVWNRIVIDGFKITNVCIERLIIVLINFIFLVGVR